MRFVHEIDIARPPAEVFAFVTDAAGWHRWHSTSVAARIVDPPLREGGSFVETIASLGIRGTITWQVRVHRSPERFSVEGVVDFPVMRRTRVQIDYRLSPTATGTRFRRQLDYEPAALVSQLADRLFFSAHNRRQSIRALTRLRETLEAGG